jgi:hypothetical protein
LARIQFNGPPGEVFTNSGDTVLYQLHCSLVRTCGLCFQFHMAIGPSFPIPYHRGCNCTQVPVWPGQSAEPFVDFREVIRELGPDQQSAVMGVSNLRLVESGVVSYEDVVTRTRVRDLREVVSRNRLTVRDMTRSGVGRREAERAFETVNTPAHELAVEKRRELVEALRGKSIADAMIADAVAERIARRILVADDGTADDEEGEGSEDVEDE